MPFDQDVLSGKNFFSFAALVFTLLFFVVASIYRGKTRPKSLKRLLVTALFAFFANLIEIAALYCNTIESLSNVVRTLIYTANLVSMYLTSLCFAVYTYSIIESHPAKRSSVMLKHILYAVAAVFIALMLINIPVNFAFSYDGPNLIIYPMHDVLGYVGPMFNLLWGLAGIIINFRELNKRERAALLSTHIIVAFGGAAQAILEDRILVVSFTITIGLYIIYSFLETHDYYELLKANRKLLAAEQKASAANRAKSSFLSAMSHEIRTPMNAVIGMNELTRMALKNPGLSDEEKIRTALEYSSNIESAGESLLYIINDILDASKIESGKMNIVCHPYYLKELLNELNALFAYQASAKNLSFEMTVDESLPGYVNGDRVRVRQIVTNVVSNAFKYTNKGGVKVNISGRVSDNNVIYDIIVADTGIGIRQENIDKLFTSFARVESEETHHIEGTGLGLSIVKSLLELMQGSVEVESEYGKGSVFTLHIPQEKLSDEKLSEYVNKDKTANDETAGFSAKGRNILIVDDNKTNIKVAELFLNTLSASVDTATSGREGLKLIESRKYDIIFLDHMMPGMGGDEVLKTVRNEKRIYSLNADTPIIAMTANVAEGIEKKYVDEMGFTDYIGKPFKFAEITDMLRKYIRTA